MNTLTDLNKNDKVIFSSGRSLEVKEIKRITPTQIILEFKNYADQPYERKFRKDNGYEIGNSYYYPKISLYDEAEMKTYYKEVRRKKLINIGLNVQDLETSEEVFEFLKSKNLIK